MKKLLKIAAGMLGEYRDRTRERRELNLRKKICQKYETGMTFRINFRHYDDSVSFDRVYAAMKYVAKKYGYKIGRASWRNYFTGRGYGEFEAIYLFDSHYNIVLVTGTNSEMSSTCFWKAMRTFSDYPINVHEIKPIIESVSEIENMALRKAVGGLYVGLYEKI